MQTIKLTSNNHEFIQTDYNGIRVIIDAETGYYNASKICRDNGKQFKDIAKQGYWQEYCAEVNASWVEDKYPPPELSYKLVEISNEFKGIYIHLDLVNFLCMHVDIPYAVKVSKIMNAHNEEIHLRKIQLEQIVDELQQKFAELERVTGVLKDLVVPIENSEKKLYILKLDNETYKLSADSTRKFPNVYREYTVPASMNIKQLLKDVGAGNYQMHNYYEFSFVILRDVEAAIEAYIRTGDFIIENANDI